MSLICQLTSEDIKHQLIIITALYTWVCAEHSSLHLGVRRAQLYTPRRVQGTALYTCVCAGHSSLHLGVRRAQLYKPGRVQGTAYVHLGVCGEQLYTPGCVQSTALYTWVCAWHSSRHLVCAGHSAIHLGECRAQLYWAIQRSWFARVNALCNLSRKKSREVAAHFRADF